MKRIPAVLACVWGAAAAAQTASSASPPQSMAVTAQEKVLQKGMFELQNCRFVSAEPGYGYNDCLCEGDLSYPEITGMRDPRAQSRLNARLKHAAEKSECPGRPLLRALQEQDGGISHKERFEYEVTFQSARLLAFMFTKWTYTGGAHGDYWVEGKIVDLERGVALTISDLFRPRDMHAINQVIYTTLAARPESAEIERKSFVNMHRCAGCTVKLTPKGLSVVFQRYEVAAFARGNPEVPIPLQYANYPPLSAALHALPAAPATPGQ